jgi:hypothetical protein
VFTGIKSLPMKSRPSKISHRNYQTRLLKDCKEQNEGAEEKWEGEPKMLA